MFYHCGLASDLFIFGHHCYSFVPNKIKFHEHVCVPVCIYIFVQIACAYMPAYMQMCMQCIYFSLCLYEKCPILTDIIFNEQSYKFTKNKINQNIFSSFFSITFFFSFFYLLSLTLSGTRSSGNNFMKIVLCQSYLCWYPAFLKNQYLKF